MKNIILTITITISVFTLFAQSIANVAPAQRTDGSKIVDITYDLNGSEPVYTIIAEASFDEGATFAQIDSISGDIGVDITPDTGKEIVWNFGNEFPNQYSATTQIRITASLVPSWVCGDNLVDDRDSQSYTTLQIGTQCWMSENLNIGTMVNGSNNQTNNGTIEKYCYDNNTSNCDTYGGLYQWDEAMQYVTTAGTQGICPTGWHFPTDDEYKILEMQLGMSSSEANNIGYRGTDEGSKLAGNEPLWTNGSLDQNANFGTSGFNGLSGGSQSTDGSFYNLGNVAFFLSSSENGTNAYSRRLFFDHIQVYRDYGNKSYGFSVRCVRNEATSNQAPDASNVNFSGTLEVGQSLTGSYTYSDNESDPEGISTYVWYRADDINGANQVVINGATSLTYTLQAADQGKYIAFEVTPIASSGTSTGTPVMSSYQGAIGTVTFACGNALIDNRDSQSYTTVQIGTQCWMSENLNIGTMINSSSSSDNQTNNGTIEKYCYGNNTNNCDTYGGLYQWDEAMQYVTTAGTQGICPTGWHFPTDDEYKTLEMQLGMTQAQADATGWRGTDEGSKLAGNEPLWTNGNLDQNANFGISGFLALPVGYRDTGGVVGNLTSDTHFWSSSETGENVWVRYLDYYNTKVYRYFNSKAYGFSVRCVRN